MSLIRDNLMTREGYSPYCGSPTCKYHWPRTHFIRGQFRCACGWASEFDEAFIKQYKQKRGLQ